MNKHSFSWLLVFTLLAGASCKNSLDELKIIKSEVLQDKIAGGWAGQIIGCTVPFMACQPGSKVHFFKWY